MAIYYITFAIAIYCEEKKHLEKEEFEIEYSIPFHLEYELIPNESIYQVEVICYGSIAKVKTLNCDFIIKTTKHGELVWIVFSLTHFLNLDKKSITEIISNSINVKLWPQKGKAKKGQKEDKQKVMKKNETENLHNRWNTWLTQALLEETVPPIIEDQELRIEDLKMLQNKFASSPHPQHWVEILQHIQGFKILEKLKKEDEERDCNNAEVKRVRKKQEYKGKGKKVKEGKSSKKNQTEITTMKLSSGSLFAGKRSIQNQTMIRDQNLIHAAVILSGENLMTEDDAIELNPFVIKINKIKNIPFQVLSEANIKKICVKYEIFDKNSIETEHREINGPYILIDHAKVILTNNMENVKLLEYLQTSHLFITVFGIQNDDVRHSLEDKMDTLKKQRGVQPLLTKKNHSEHSIIEEKHIKIAVAYCHLSNLLQGQAFLEEELPLFSATSFSTRYSNRNNSKDCLSLGINNELLMNLSSIEVFLSFTLPLTMNSERLDTKGHTCYNRLFIKIKDYRIANSILSTIVSINVIILSKINRAQTTTIQGQIENDTVKKMKENILTGFVIDSIHYKLIFVEGISNGYILKLYNQAQRLHSSSCKIMYKSNLVFTSRLYAPFLPNGGIFMVILKNSPKKYLSKASTYTEEMKSKPCWEAIKLIDALIKCNNIQTASQDELFPTSVQLLSLDLEFGSPCITEEKVEI